MTELQNGLPAGWDSKYDEQSEKYYYINHITRTTTWEDPRYHHKPTQGGPPKIFGEYIPLKEMRTSTRSPISLRGARVQDSAFTVANSQLSTDSDDSVAKISAMFPTVSQTHIKLLLKKYLNREALVISALQVEKHPITTPGPFATPPPQRNIHVGVKGAVSRAGSPAPRGLTGAQGFRNSPKPHSSPKLKLRYMKSLFPAADETIILEALQNNDSSIQKTSEVLREMGFTKKETVKPATPKVNNKMDERVDKIVQDHKTPPPLPRMKTAEEKQLMREKLQYAYKDVPEHLISIALESVHFNESRASQILQIMKQEDSEIENNQKNKKKRELRSETDSAASSQVATEMPVSQSRQSLKSLLKSEKKEEVSGFSRVINEVDEKYRSLHLSNTVGHNTELAKGPNSKILLENYLQWQGSNKSLQKGPQSLAKGADRSLLSGKIYTPRGPNSELRMGPKCGLAKGSIFAQLKTVMVGESRAK